MTQQKITDAIASSDKETKLWKTRFAAAKGAYSMGEFRQCESQLYLAMEQAKSLKEHTFATNTCHVGLGALYIATGKPDKAREELQHAINALSGSGDPALRELYAVALRFHSQLLSDAGDYAGAETQLKQAMQILEDLGVDGAVQLAYTLSDLASVYVLMGNLQEARELIFDSMSLLESLVGPEHPEYMRANMIYNICDIENEEDRLAKAEDSIFRMQYYHGQKHPSVTRALGRYLKRRQELGENDKIEEARERFSIHSKALT